MNILEKIVQARKKNYDLQLKKIKNYLPASRKVPLIPFFTKKNILICEFKKASPSKGNFRLKQSYKDILKDYLAAGVNNFSVLTEENYFYGSLLDLINLKKLQPHKAFLRKDFLYCTEDLKISYLAGADAVLLISEILPAKLLTQLIKTAHKYGMQTLCEVHSKKELQKVLKLKVKPTAIGINARDLTTFEVNPSIPLMLKPYIPSKIKTVFESGVNDPYLLQLIGNSRFTAVLIGEAVATDPQRIKLIKNFSHAFNTGLKQVPNFFTKLYSLKKNIFIKICGITSRADAGLAKKLGANVLGLILAKSPRQIDINFIKSLKKFNILKVAVVKDQNIPGLADLLKNNYIDGVQFHGRESKELVYSFGGNAYKVITTPSALRAAPLKGEHKFDCLPVQLSDFSNPIGSWIAGKLNPQNIRKIIKKVKPQLVDVCSGVEAKPGKKDPVKLRKFIREVKNV